MKTSIQRPRIAALVSEYRRYSHGQNIVDRLLGGYGWESRWHRPELDVVSLYVDQVPESDLSHERLERHADLTLYPSVSEALTRGGSTLDVDGVLLIAEHGDYPKNEKGQTLYPRYEFFSACVEVFRASGRSVPLFLDKHLSWSWDRAIEMVETSRELGFAFMAGSSLPVTWRPPALDMPLGAAVREAVCVAYGGVDSYDFHALETLQCMVERRQGGEKGVKWLQAFQGDAFWEAHAQQLWSRELFEAALCRSHTLTPGRAGFNNPFPTLDEMKQLVGEPTAYHYEHEDGLKCTMLLLNGLVQDFNFAAHLDDRDAPLSTQMYLPMPPARTTLANFFTPQVNNVEKMFLSGKASYPVERTLLTSGLVSAGVESIFQDCARQQTPHLSIAYQPTTESTFWRT